MVCAIERQAHHLQRAGHAYLFDLPGLGKAALEVHMLEGCERVLDAVPLAIAGKLLGIELAPAPPRCARCLMALGEAGQPCRDRWEQLGTVHVGLLDVGELPTKGSELRACHGAHQRLKRVEHAALNRSPHRADLDDLHIARREAIAIVAGGLKVDDQHGRKRPRPLVPCSGDPLLPVVRPCAWACAVDQRRSTTAQCCGELVAPRLGNLGQHNIGTTAGPVDRHAGQQLSGRHVRRTP